MYKENITVEELAEHELSWFKGEIVLIDNLKIFYEVFPRLLRSELLGFDTETRPTFKKGKKNSVSLIQLSTEDLACLFRINKIGIPDELVELLSDPSVIKAGVAVHDDIRFLKGVRKFSPEGFIDLQSIILVQLSHLPVGSSVSHPQTSNVLGLPSAKTYGPSR